MGIAFPPQVLHALIQGLCDAMDDNLSCADEAIVQACETVLAEHGTEIPSELRARCLELARLRRACELENRAFETARAAGNDAAADTHLATLGDLAARTRDLLAHLHIPDDAQSLLKAKSFDDFCARLHGVPLDTLYGSGYGKISPFPLIWALSARDKPLERVQLMLAAGARVDLRTRLGETVLHAMAAMNRKAAIRLPILRLLVFKRADLEAEDIHGRTPLTVAVTSGSAEDVGHFLAAGSRIRQIDLKSATSDPDKLSRLLDHLSDDPDGLAEAASLTGWLRGEIEHWKLQTKEALRKGAKGEFHGKAQAKLEQSLDLLERLPGATPSGTSRKLTWSDEPAAFWAIENAETLEDYRAALAKVEITTFGLRGTHPIYWPIEARANRPERLWLMLAAGASVKGGENGTALHIFAGERRRDAREQFRIAQMLVQADADLEALNYEGNTPLMVAVAGGGHAEAAALLALGAKPDCTLSTRRLFGDGLDLPLIFAAANDVRIFRSLLEIGAETGGRTSDGEPLRAYLATEIDRLTAMLSDDTSATITRRITKSIGNLQKSLKLLDTG